MAGSRVLVDEAEEEGAFRTVRAAAANSRMTGLPKEADAVAPFAVVAGARAGDSSGSLKLSSLTSTSSSKATRHLLSS